MKYEFKQAALLGSGLGLEASKSKDGKPLKTVGGRRHLYPKGVHEVSEEHQKDPTFVHFAKHGLIVPAKAKAEQGTLKPASSDIAKASSAAAQSQLEPDAEIGGEDSEPDFGEDDGGKKKKGKR